MYLNQFGNATDRDLVTGLTAAGSAYTDALQLVKDFNVIGTAAAGTGVKLPFSSPLGRVVRVRNGGANTVVVYPPTGFKINGGSANAGVNVASGAVATFVSDGADNYWQF